MRSRRQQQAQTLTEEVAQLRQANQQLLERLQIASQAHQDALQQNNLLRNELMTFKQTLVLPHIALPCLSAVCAGLCIRTCSCCKWIAVQTVATEAAAGKQMHASSHCTACVLI